MSLSTTGLNAVKLKLAMLATIPSFADDELRKCADETLEMSRNMAPENYGDLKRAIQLGRRGGLRNALGHFMKGSSTYEIFISKETATADPDKLKLGITKVIQYAWEVHQYMTWAGGPIGKGYIQPSAKSVELGKLHGVDSGGMFMERAAAAVFPSVTERLAKVVTMRMNSLDK